MATEDDLRLRHLADGQAVIERLSQHSFVIRGWSVTLVSVVFAILSTRERTQSWPVLIALAPALVFWILDAYYLRQERLYRCLYLAAGRRLTDGEAGPDVAPFDMDVSRYSSHVRSFTRTLFASHVLAIPAMLTVLIVTYHLAMR